MTDPIQTLRDYAMNTAFTTRTGPFRQDALDALTQVENLVRAAQGVMTQTDYETPHHTRLRDALAPFKNTP